MRRWARTRRHLRVAARAAGLDAFATAPRVRLGDTAASVMTLDSSLKSLAAEAERRNVAPAELVYDALLGRGVIVRPMAAWGLPTCIRISVGTPDETTGLEGT